jgi:class 3 adenylate cyclase
VRALPGADHLPWEGAQEDVLREIEAFLAGLDEPDEPDRVLTTVLHVRIPEGRRALLRAHVSRFRGTQLAGAEGVLRAHFDGPARAIRCARALVDHAGSLGEEAAAGLHTGECERDGDALRGVPLELAAAVASVAAPGEVLVSSTVRDLVAGSGAEFAERRTVALDVGDARADWRLYVAL